MPQATLDPAVMDAPQGEASDADDLLSKMVGEEVDTLLAEAEAVRAPIPAPAPTPPADAAAPNAPAADLLPSDVAGIDPAKIGDEDTAIAAQLDELIDGLKDPATATAPGTAPTPAPTPELPPAPAAAAGGITAEAVVLPAAIATDPPPVTPEAAEAARMEVLAAELEVDPTPPADPAAVADPAATTVTEAAAATAAAPAAPAETPLPKAEPTDASVPLLLRPLIWMNSPMNNCPDPVRSLIGKAAILTLINAAGLLIYVAVFRKHH